jgi:hypothetical protein
MKKAVGLRINDQAIEKVKRFLVASTMSYASDTDFLPFNACAVNPQNSVQAIAVLVAKCLRYCSS